MNTKQLENLADYQKYLLIEKGKHVDELKQFFEALEGEE